jgi:epoxyqueuosine reductase
VVKKALKALARWLVDAAARAGLGEIGVKVFVDTAPVMEKPLAAAAGLGWQGKHTNVVSRDHGSWLFLGAIYTTLPFAPGDEGRNRCGSCQACQDACPTGAFPAPYRLDARRCVSYLTIEHKGPIRRNSARRWATGSMVAMIVWPYVRGTNLPMPRRKIAPFCPAPNWSRQSWANCWGWMMRGSGACSPARPSSGSGAIALSAIASMRRGTAGDAALIGPVSALLGDEDEAVAEAALWALGRLRGKFCLRRAKGGGPCNPVNGFAYCWRGGLLGMPAARRTRAIRAAGIHFSTPRPTQNAEPLAQRRQ